MNDKQIIISEDEIRKIKELKRRETLDSKMSKIKTQSDIEEARKNREKRTNEFKSQEEEIIVLETISKNKRPKEKELRYKLHGYIFNVAIQERSNTTRFIVAPVDDEGNTAPAVEFTILGTDNNFKGGGFLDSSKYYLEFDSIDKPTILFIDGKKQTICDPNNLPTANELAELKKEESKDNKEPSEKWIENLSFYKNSFFQRNSSKKLNLNEIEELKETIMNDDKLIQTEKFLLIQKIKNFSSIRLKDVHSLYNDNLDVSKSKDKA